MAARRARIIRFPGPPADSDDARLVRIHRCDQAEALVVRGLLESHGIPTLLRSRLAQSVHPFTVGDQGEVTVLVPEADVDRALLLLARITPGSSLP